MMLHIVLWYLAFGCTWLVCLLIAEGKQFIFPAIKNATETVGITKKQLMLAGFFVMVGVILIWPYFVYHKLKEEYERGRKE